MDNKKLPVFNLKITFKETEDDTTTMDAFSLVENPAIQLDWHAFAATIKPQNFKFKVENADQRLLLGPLMVPGMPIYRREVDSEGNTTKEYYVIIDRESIENAKRKFMRDGLTKAIKKDHEFNLNKPGESNIYMTEIWSVEDPEIDKSALHKFNMPEGSLMTTVFVQNEQMWEDYIKTGEVKGFSIEGIFERGNLLGYSSEDGHDVQLFGDEKEVETIKYMIENEFTNQEVEDLLKQVNAIK